MPVCADQLMYTFNRKLLLSFCSVECQSHLGKNVFITNPKNLCKIGGLNEIGGEILLLCTSFSSGTSPVKPIGTYMVIETCLPMSRGFSA